MSRKPTRAELIRVLETSRLYLSHPEVQAIGFALPASNVVRMIDRTLDGMREPDPEPVQRPNAPKNAPCGKAMAEIPDFAEHIRQCRTCGDALNE